MIEEIPDLHFSSAAVVFPGQGSQKPGMGRDFYKVTAISRETYEEASHVLGWDVAGICFTDNKKLDLTEFSQPCILTTEIAIFRALRDLYGFHGQFFGGHSLGEYAALVAADVIPFHRAVSAVHARGRLMQNACPQGTGGMAACLSPEIDAVRLREVIGDLPLDVANINAPDQIVISGAVESLPVAEKRLQQVFSGEASLQFIPLNVSAPFHSRFMKPIEAPFRKILEVFAQELLPKRADCVTANYTGAFHDTNSKSIVDCLVAQISNPVNWCDNMQALGRKASRIYEIGPRSPLKRFFRKMGIPCKSLTTLSAAERQFCKSSPALKQPPAGP